MSEEACFRGTGRRKTSVAQVRLYPGKGIIQVNGKVSALLGKELSVVTFYSYPSVHSLVRHLNGQGGGKETSNREKPLKEAALSESKETLQSTIKKMKKFS